MKLISLAGEQLNRFFGLRDSGSSFSVELRAGLASFLAMAYILIVNPEILGQAIIIPGVDVKAQLMTTTALAAAVGSFLMAFIARYPFALAPGMGANAYFAFTVVLTQHVPWQTALGAVFISGAVFAALSVTGFREVLLNSIPLSIKLATTAGIGLFLAVLGFKNAGLITAHPATLIALGDPLAPSVLLCLFGLICSGSLLVLRVRGALVIGMLLTSILAVMTKAPVYQGQPFAGFNGRWFQTPNWPVDLFFKLDLAQATNVGLFGVIFFFVFVSLFDTAGTLFGLSDRSGFCDANGHLPRAGHAFLADALATMFGALLGTSTTAAYVESAAGIQEGGRTGITAVVVGVLFLVCIFFWPLAAAVPGVATAPTLIILGVMMMSSLARIDWQDYSVSIPAFCTMVGMPLTFSIANGISFGIIVYTIINLMTGRIKHVHPLLVVVTGLLITRYVYFAEP